MMRHKLNTELCVTTCLLFVMLSACVNGEADKDRAILLAKHQDILTAFLTADHALLVSNMEAQAFGLLSSSGVTKWVEKNGDAERKQTLKMFELTQYSKYQDSEPPLIKISQNGNLAWVLASVEMEGVSKSNDGGSSRTFEAETFWLEVYVKKDGNWVYKGGVVP